MTRDADIEAEVIRERKVNRRLDDLEIQGRIFKSRGNNFMLMIKALRAGQSALEEQNKALQERVEALERFMAMACGASKGG